MKGAAEVVDKAQVTRLGMLALLAFALLMAGSYFMGSDQGNEMLLVTFPSGTQVRAEVADTPLMLHAGLAFRDSLPPDWAMLFIFDRTDFHRLTTSQYRFPVDLLWLDEAKRILLIVEGAKPCLEEACPHYGPPPEKARYILAMNAGFVRKERLALGENLRFTLRL